MQAWASLSANRAYRTVAMCPGWQPGFAPPGRPRTPGTQLVYLFQKGKVLTSLMTCLQAPQGEIKSSCRSLWGQRIKPGSVSPEA